MIPEWVPIHEVVDVVITTLDARDPDTYQHSFRVALFTEVIAQHMNLAPEVQHRLHIAAHLHDIGKIGIPDAILNNPGRLTKEEFAQIRQHPAIGDQIIGKVRILRSVSDIVRHHHERIDGGGYPDGLAGEQISLGARIVAVADAFDAMMNTRTYREALGLSETLREMRRCSGSQFDSNVVRALLQLVESTAGASLQSDQAG